MADGTRSGRGWIHLLVGAALAAFVAWLVVPAGRRDAPPAPPVRPDPPSPARPPAETPPDLSRHPFPEADAARLRILGVVVDGTGRAVEGAVVRVRRWRRGAGEGLATGTPFADDDLLGEETAGAGGAFRFLAPDAGACTLVAAREGFAPAVLEGILPAPGDRAVPVRLVLRAGLALTVRVLDAARAPVAGAEVEATAVVGHAPVAPPLARGTTDAKGEVLLGALPAGSLAVAARRAGGGAVVVKAWFSRAQTVEVLLGGEAALRVVVRDGAGEPIEGADVAVLVDGPAGTTLRGRTDAEGRAAWDGLSPGRVVQATAEKAGFAAAQSVEGAGAEMVERRPLDVAIVLGRGAVVRGRVLQGTGGPPVPGVPVRLHCSRRFPLEGHLSATTDAAGEFRFEGVPRGAALAVAERAAPSAARGEARIEVPAEEGAEVQQDIALAEPGVVRGRIVASDGSPVQGALVTIAASGGGAPGGAREGPGAFGLPGPGTRSVRTAGDGTFEATGIPPGDSLEARASKEGLLAGVSAPFVLPPGASAEGIEVRLAAGGAAAGRVTEVDGPPVPGATVTAVPSGEGNAGATAGWTRVTDAAGEFRIAGLPDGTFTLHVEAAGFRPATLAGLASVEGTETPADAVLSRGLSVAGRVVDRAGRPVGRARVSASAAGAAKGAGGLGSTTSDSGGAFLLEGLPPGPCRLRAEAASFAPATVDGVAAGATDVVLTMEEGLEIRGRVVDREGRGVRGAWVNAKPEGGGPPAASAPSGPDGAFAVTGLLAGPYALEVHGGPLHVPRTVPGVAAGRTDVEVVLEASNVVSGRVLDAEGNPYPGRYMLRVHGENDAVVPATMTRWAKGRFRFTGLPPGEYVLRAKSLDDPGAEGECPVRTGNASVEIRIK
jgi:protocatechuate 3,4-dioxygenase beta subunit